MLSVIAIISKLLQVVASENIYFITMKYSLELVVFFLVAMVACRSNTEKVSQQESKAVKPNILFILADDLGYSDLSCMGSKFYESPNIDRLANKGMIFTNGYAACQVCSPSRASILNGKFPARHGITDWIGAKYGEEWRKSKRYTKLLPPNYEHHLDHDDTVLPEAFKENGYKTFFAGKWHLGNEGSYPQDHGFDENEGGYERGGPYSGGFFSPFDNPQMEDHHNELGMSLPEKLAKETNQFITENKDQPFLAYLSFYAVHAPIQTTRDNWRKYRDKAELHGIKDHGFEMERRMPIRQHQDNPVYAGLIEHMDDAVGQVLAKLDELGLAENTIVVFTSDNGGVTSGDNYSTNLDPLRGGKGYQWEGGIRIPYLIYVPWMNHGGVRNETRVTGTDFYPTLLDLAGLELKPNIHLDGVSIKPLLQCIDLEERSLIWHYPHYGNQGGDPSSIIIRNNLKLIYYHEDESIEFYDLNVDDSEKNDLSDNEKEIAFKLKQELIESLKEMNAKFPDHDPSYSQDSFEIRQSRFLNETMPRLEAQRANMLSETYVPNVDWWGSLVED